MFERGPVPALRYFVEMLPKWLPWMSVNLALAFIPVGLAFVLFRPGRRTTPAWWAGFIAFVIFLPNAPYVLTNYRWLNGPWLNAWYHNRWRFAVIVPFWGLYFALGFGAFVFSSARAHRFIAARRSALAGWLAVILLIAGCALGLYLGRADLFSWSVVTEPGAVVDVLAAADDADGVRNMVVAFVALLGGYVACVATARAARRRRARSAGSMSGRHRSPRPIGPAPPCPIDTSHLARSGSQVESS